MSALMARIGVREGHLEGGSLEIDPFLTVLAVFLVPGRVLYPVHSCWPRPQAYSSPSHTRKLLPGEVLRVDSDRGLWKLTRFGPEMTVLARSRSPEGCCTRCTHAGQLPIPKSCSRGCSEGPEGSILAGGLWKLTRFSQK